MSANIRKLSLTAHITLSVGWLGSVACSLALAIAGLVSRDAHVVRASYVALGLTTAWITIPLSFGSLLGGVVQSIVSPWGLVRHYWVLVKLVLTVFATTLLLVHAQPIRLLATQATLGTLVGGELQHVRIHVAADAAAALITLLVATILSVYKPRGATPWGTQRRTSSSAG
jgi:hypothetical protein